MKIDIWTDGSCEPNPGVGGWAAILLCDGRTKEIYGRVPQCTNIRAEIIAAIEALKALKGGPHEVTFFTDSDYVRAAVVGMKKPKANLDLIAEMNRLKEAHTVSVKWIKGHNGDVNNERCDVLANMARGN